MLILVGFGLFLVGALCCWAARKQRRDGELEGKREKREREREKIRLSLRVCESD
jgi:hypothetical protein